MERTIDWINSIISELVNPATKIGDTLLKVQVLAFKIKNDKLKIWVDGELNGYVGKGKVIPKYREIPVAVLGTLEQDRGFGGLARRDRVAIPMDYLEKKTRDALITIFINNSVAEIEKMIENNGDYHRTIPHFFYNDFTKLFTNGWVVTSASQQINNNSLTGIVNSIKSTLLTFLLELADEIGEKDNLDFAGHKKEIDQLFDKTIGNVSAETVNISLGEKSMQTIVSGENAIANIARGSKMTQTANADSIRELKEFLTDLKLQIDKLSLNNDDRSDVLSEIKRIETQIERAQPKYPIIKQALDVVQGILIGVAGNALTPPIIERISLLIQYFSN